MITEQARVIDNSRPGQVEVEVERQSACGHCEVKSACGVGAIGRLLGTRKPRIKVSTELPLKIGDIVTIGIPESSLVKTSFAIYLVPLVVLMVAAVTGQVLFSLPEWANLLISLFFSVIAWFVVAARIKVIEVSLLPSSN